jgi:hypothetical protein
VQYEDHPQLPVKAKIGFVSGGSSSMRHYASFLPLIPHELDIDFQGLELYRESLYEIVDKKELIIRRIKELAAERAWDGVMISGAPTEVLNPGLLENLRAELSIPFTTALHACVSALRAYSAKRVLLLTPFDRTMNEMICVYLKERGILGRAPHPFDDLALPKGMDPDQVFDLTRRQLNPADPVDAVYFQGAVLDPIKVLQRIETELGTTAIASNPAMLWYLLSMLDLPHPIAGYGRLLREWPKAFKP